MYFYFRSWFKIERNDFLTAMDRFSLDISQWTNLRILIWILFGKITLWVSRVLKYPKQCLKDLTTLFMSTWWGDSKNMKEIEFSRWLFEVRPRQGKNVLPDGLNWLCYFTGRSKSHCENSIYSYFWNPLIK